MRRAASVRVLLVYPAVDSVFQRSVMLLAESLQSRGGIHVVIDMWERGSLAEQGPLRWLNTQADLSERVLLISPPQCTHTGNNVCVSCQHQCIGVTLKNLYAPFFFLRTLIFATSGLLSYCARYLLNQCFSHLSWRTPSPAHPLSNMIQLSSLAETARPVLGV